MPKSHNFQILTLAHHFFNSKNYKGWGEQIVAKAKRLDHTM